MSTDQMWSGYVTLVVEDGLKVEVLIRVSGLKSSLTLLEVATASVKWMKTLTNRQFDDRVLNLAKDWETVGWENEMWKKAISIHTMKGRVVSLDRTLESSWRLFTTESDYGEDSPTKPLELILVLPSKSPVTVEKPAVEVRSTTTASRGVTEEEIRKGLQNASNFLVKRHFRKVREETEKLQSMITDSSLSPSLITSFSIQCSMIQALVALYAEKFTLACSIANTILQKQNENLLAMAIFGHASYFLGLDGDVSHKEAALKALSNASRLWKSKPSLAKAQSILLPAITKRVSTPYFYLELIGLSALLTASLSSPQGGADLLNQAMSMPESEQSLSLLVAYASLVVTHMPASAAIPTAIPVLLKCVALTATLTEEAADAKLAEQSLSSRYFSNEFRRLLVVTAGEDAGIETLTGILAPNSVGSGEVYHHLAQAAREAGGIQTQRRLLTLAITSDTCDPQYALASIHAATAAFEFKTAMDVTKYYLKNGGDRATSAFLSSQILRQHASASSVLAALSVMLSEEGRTRLAAGVFINFNEQNEQFSVRFADSELTAQFSQISSILETSLSKTSHSNDALLYTAFLASIIKAAFLSGDLRAAAVIIPFVEILRRSSSEPLHQTLIRNEMAYYRHTVQLLSCYFPDQPTINQNLYEVWDRIGAGLGPATNAEKWEKTLNMSPVYVLGDSHSLSLAWRRVTVRGVRRVYVSLLVTGVKAWHLRPDSTFYTKAQFAAAIKCLPEGSDVITSIGEIDCREGILHSLIRDQYASVEEAMQVTQKYFQNVLLLLAKKSRVWVHPIPPVLPETRMLVDTYNDLLAARLSSLSPNVKMLDFVRTLADENGLCAQYKHDGTHLSPNYVSLVETAIAATL